MSGWDASALFSETAVANAEKEDMDDACLSRGSLFVPFLQLETGH